MRRLTIVLLVAAALVGLRPGTAQATGLALELRHTPMRIRPMDLPSLCLMVSFSPTERLWIGVGYELIQDYDAIAWKSEYEGYKPIAMSGIRAGAWYRGGPAHWGFSWAIGPLFTYASPAISDGGKYLGSDTYVLDLGGDASAGYVWGRVRLSGFGTPAWSLGRIVSPAVDSKERYSAFTWRVGLAFAVLFGS
jgi:hypothetical protein